MTYLKLLIRIAQQKKWIEDCEANGVSYADPVDGRGDKIRQADMNELTRLQSQLDHTPAPYLLS